MPQRRTAQRVELDPRDGQSALRVLESLWVHEQALRVIDRQRGHHEGLGLDELSQRRISQRLWGMHEGVRPQAQSALVHLLAERVHIDRQPAGRRTVADGVQYLGAVDLPEFLKRIPPTRIERTGGRGTS